MTTMIPFFDLRAMHVGLEAEFDVAWRDVLASARFVGGEVVERFEAEWACYCGTRCCVGVSDGTAALTLALVALGIGAGDEVIVPANTFIATAEAVVAAGATAVFADVDPGTLLLSADTVEAVCTARTAAAIAVHLYGQPVDMDAINALAASKRLAVIEDAAQAHGATWRCRRVGSLGAVGCFSFYPSKNLGAFGDAPGAVVTDDEALAERVRSIANHGRQKNTQHLHSLIGRNHRLDCLQAAVLSLKLRHLDDWNEARERLARRYRQLLAGSRALPVTIAAAARSSHHLEVVRVPRRDEVQRYLTRHGIGTGIHYPIACHRQPAFVAVPTPPLPVAEAAANDVLSLPMYPHLTEAAVDRVASVLEQALEGTDDVASCAA